MKYTIYNASLDFLKKDLGIKTISELEEKVGNESISSEKLLEICYEVGSPVIYDIKRNKDNPLNNQIGSRNITKTLDALINHVSYSDYQPINLLPESQQKRLEKQSVFKNLGTANIGDSTFRQMAQVKLGIFKLRPFETAEMEVDTSWMKDNFMKKAFCKDFIITDGEGNMYKYIKPIDVVVQGFNYVQCDKWIKYFDIKLAPGAGIVIMKKEIIKQAKAVMTTEEFEELINSVDGAIDIDDMEYSQLVTKAKELNIDAKGKAEILRGRIKETLK